MAQQWVKTVERAPPNPSALRLTSRSSRALRLKNHSSTHLYSNRYHHSAHSELSPALESVPPPVLFAVTAPPLPLLLPYLVQLLRLRDEQLLAHGHRFGQQFLPPDIDEFEKDGQVSDGPMESVAHL